MQGLPHARGHQEPGGRALPEPSHVRRQHPLGRDGARERARRSARVGSGGRSQARRLARRHLAAEWWESGALDASGDVDPEARRFGATLLGADGLPLAHHDILAVSGLADVRLLAPGKPHREDYAASWANGAAYPVTIRAELRYRRARQDFMDHVYGVGARTMPVTVLVTASCELTAPDRPCEAKPS